MLGDIYGNEYLSYNVYNLIHFPNAVKTFGLENFSCLKIICKKLLENYMGR